MAVDHYGLDGAGIEEIQQVIVLEILVGGGNRNHLLALGTTFGIQTLHVLVVTAGLTQVEPGLYQVIKGTDVGGGRPGDYQLQTGRAAV